MPERQHAAWGELLREAVEKPGRMLEAYTAFHNYSFGNALLALEQCTRRNLQPGPLNTYNGWLAGAIGCYFEAYCVGFAAEQINAGRFHESPY